MKKKIVGILAWLFITGGLFAETDVSVLDAYRDFINDIAKKIVQEQKGDQKDKIERMGLVFDAEAILDKKAVDVLLNIVKSQKKKEFLVLSLKTNPKIENDAIESIEADLSALISKENVYRVVLKLSQSVLKDVLGKEFLKNPTEEACVEKLKSLSNEDELKSESVQDTLPAVCKKFVTILNAKDFKVFAVHIAALVKQLKSLAIEVYSEKVKTDEKAKANLDFFNSIDVNYEKEKLTFSANLSMLDDENKSSFKLELQMFENELRVMLQMSTDHSSYIKIYENIIKEWLTKPAQVISASEKDKLNYEKEVRFFWESAMSLTLDAFRKLEE